MPICYFNNDYDKKYKCSYVEKGEELEIKVDYNEYIKIDRDKSTFKSHRDFDSEIEMTFKHF